MTSPKILTDAEILAICERNAEAIERQETVRLMLRDLDKRGREGCEWTIEPGRGETYAHGRPTLYFHHPYGDSSVLAGQLCRCHRGEVGDVDAFLKALPDGLRKMVVHLDGGTTYRDVESVVAHLPKEDDR